MIQRCQCKLHLQHNCSMHCWRIHQHFRSKYRCPGSHLRNCNWMSHQYQCKSHFRGNCDCGVHLVHIHQHCCNSFHYLCNQDYTGKNMRHDNLCMKRCHCSRLHIHIHWNLQIGTICRLSYCMHLNEVFVGNISINSQNHFPKITKFTLFNA